MRTRNYLLHLPAIVLLSALFFSSCKIADIRTPLLLENGVTEDNAQKGKALLQQAWQAQGFDKIQAVSTYEITARDHWPGLLGKMGNLWPDNDQSMRLRYAKGTFDGQVMFLEGKGKDEIAGQQAWNYYVKLPGQDLIFQPEQDARISFGLAAFQYFFELADRLRNVPTLSYAGEKQLEGNTYDLVFATWNSVEPTEEYDQYLLYLNQENHLLEFATYTVRDNYLPGAANLYATIRFSDFREINGFKVPFHQEVYLNGPGERGDYTHRLQVESFQFDSFDKQELYPRPEIGSAGDAKPLD